MHFPGPGFRLDRSRNATVQVFEQLRELIVSLVVAPGTVLPRPQLCAYFGLSQAPVREALLRLEEERLVDIFPQHQTRVRGIDLAAARQAHFLRLSVELEMVHVLARQPNPALERTLLALVARQQACLASDDLAGFTRLDIEFHRHMYEAAVLPDLWSMMRSASGNLDRLRRLHLPLSRKADSIIAQHALIARCIGAGDADGAQAQVRMHLSGTLNALDALRERYPDLMLPADFAPPSLAA
ncbi:MULTISPECIES: GntR family transcriptional regulator [unclassified Massilia]|uniref:GntR family transcriptional regulator n=1 Tax=unclassified Massilia TaxID=2609279 RepID=UPI001785467B|nr:MULTISPECIES: GntR family transcriptional regulator [unclassified Massilia]MBD8531090.1 GntR family transcriptional regulator [Massilia sp. CFBP 13647]MBD8674790.1 GntR family transcriptional regulator [Massilia sp. CFBP 13721]